MVWHRPTTLRHNGEMQYIRHCTGPRPRTSIPTLLIIWICNSPIRNNIICQAAAVISYADLYEELIREDIAGRSGPNDERRDLIRSCANYASLAEFSCAAA